MNLCNRKLSISEITMSLVYFSLHLVMVEEQDAIILKFRRNLIRDYLDYPNEENIDQRTNFLSQWEDWLSRVSRDL